MSAKSDDLSVDGLSALTDDGVVIQLNDSQDIKTRFAKAVRRRRRELDLTQEQLAQISNLDRTYISLIERAERSPTLENVEKLAHGLGLKIWEFFSRYVEES